MKATLDGVSVDETGLPPIFPYPGGSFANGGAMRISPLAIAYRNASATVLRQAVEAAVRGSHRHPEAMDFAVVQAAAVQRALRYKFDPDAFFDGLIKSLVDMCKTNAMKEVLTGTARALESFRDGYDEQAAIKAVVDKVQRPGSGMGFQIASVHMAPSVLWAACRHRSNPRKALQAAIDLGGDTDTTASMVGAIVGALHGDSWCTGVIMP